MESRVYLLRAARGGPVSPDAGDAVRPQLLAWGVRDWDGCRQADSQAVVLGISSVFMRIFRFALPLIVLTLVLIVLAGCGSAALLSDVGLSSPTLQATGQGERVDIGYALGRPAKVSIYLQD